MQKLTDKQERFAQAILTHDTLSDAYRSAYNVGNMKSETINRKAKAESEKPHVAARIAELKAERCERTSIDADYVLRQAVKLHERCMQEVKPKVHRNGDQVEDEEGNPVYEFNAAGAAKSLELVGKHVNVQAFKDRIEHSGTITHEEMLDQLK